jgi:hypothetical protein
MQANAVPAFPFTKPASGKIHWILTLKENPQMKRRIGYAGIALSLAIVGLATTSLKHASALPRLAAMRKAMQSVRTAHLSIWENTSIPDGQFHRRELWVQGGLLRLYIPGYLWQISSSDTNWNYIAGKDRLERQAHAQKPVTFDFSQTLSELTEMRKDGNGGTGVEIEAGSDTTLRGRQVAQIQLTELAPTAEELLEERAKAAEIRQQQAESDTQKGLAAPVAPVEKPTAPSLHSWRSLYWVDKVTNLPLHSEDYKEQSGKWALVSRTDYFYNEQFPANLFDPQDLLRVGRQERKDTKR